MKLQSHELRQVNLIKPEKKFSRKTLIFTQRPTINNSFQFKFTSALFHFEYIYNDHSIPKPNGNPIETSENNHAMRELKPATIFVPCFN